MRFKWHFSRLFVCTILQCLTVSLADKIVYIDRPANQAVYLQQPVFNPQMVTADIGEQVHFVARFGDQREFQPSVSHSNQRKLIGRAIPLSGGVLQNPGIIVLVCIMEVRVKVFKNNSRYVLWLFLCGRRGQLEWISVHDICNRLKPSFLLSVGLEKLGQWALHGSRNSKSTLATASESRLFIRLESGGPTHSTD